MANDFFKNGDKAYSENLNDGILVGNAFDWTVDISLPTDTGSVFPNSSTVVKAKVADVSITPNSNLSIGSTISNSSSSSQVYRLTVYPNFNRFGGFKSITLEGDGTFYIANKGANTPIVNNLDYDDLSNVPELKVLKEYDIVLTIPVGGEVTGLSFGFQSSTASADASISQANVSGLVDDLSSLESGKADAEHTHSSTDVIQSNALSNIGTNANTSQSVINEAVDEMVGSLDTSITNLLIVQEKSVNLGTIESGSTKTGTTTVTSCPSGYSTMIALKTTSWCICSGASVSGTTLSLTGMNTHTGSHTCWITVYVIYYPNTWTG